MEFIPPRTNLSRDAIWVTRKTACRLPADRHADAVRFALGEECNGILHVRFASELAHLPASHGELLYEKASATWLSRHDDARVQRMAECYVQVQLQKRQQLRSLSHIHSKKI